MTENIPETKVPPKTPKKEKAKKDITNLSIFNMSLAFDWFIVFLLAVILFIFLLINATSTYFTLMSEGVADGSGSVSHVKLREKEIDKLIQSFEERETVFSQLTGLKKTTPNDHITIPSITNNSTSTSTSTSETKAGTSTLETQ